MMAEHILDYIPILIFLLVALAFPLGMLIASWLLLQPKKFNKIKLSVYECGILPDKKTARIRFSIRFYIIALLFVIFDVETIFLIPWAIVYKNYLLDVAIWFGLIEMGIFLLVLIVGYYYAWKKKALEWV
ncbi:NADH-quinone oxidoreductase subunit A [Acidobacteriota bacterium]